MQGISIFDRPTSPYWQASYDCPKRLRRVTRSTGIRVSDPTGKSQAYAWAREQSNSGTGRRLAGQADNWGNWVEPWIRDRYRDRTRTLQSYLGAWKYLALFLYEHRIHCPRQLRYNDLIAFIEERSSQVKVQSGRKVSRNTALHNIKVLSRIMREAIRREYCQHNPCYRLGEEVTADPIPEKPEFTNEHIAQIRAALKNSRSDWMRIAFEISIHQGCRISACAMPMDRIDFSRNTIQFHEKGSRGRKTIFTVPLHPGLRPILVAHRDSGATETCKIDIHCSRNFTRFLKGIGIHGFSFHCCRVTVVTRMARAGVPIQQAMAYVHHADTTIHKIYQRLSTQDLTAASDAISF